MFFKLGVLKNFANFTGKHLCWGLFIIKLQGWKVAGLRRSAILLKRESTQVFPCEICKIFKNTFFYKHLQWLLLKSKFLIFNAFPYDYVAFSLKHVALEITQTSFSSYGDWKESIAKFPTSAFCWEKQMEAIFKTLMNTRTHTLAKILRLHMIWLPMYYTKTYRSIFSALQKKVGTVINK